MRHWKAAAFFLMGVMVTLVPISTPFGASMVGALGVASINTSSDDAGNGIAVHGHWVIDVVNPDGSLASHNEFENALLACGSGGLGGACALTDFLARDNSVGLWQVLLNPNAATATGNCGASNVLCSISESSDTEPASTSSFKNLLVSNNDPDVGGGFGLGAETGKVHLAGTATALEAGSIIEVGTQVRGCADPSSLASPCDGALGGSSVYRVPVTSTNAPDTDGGAAGIQVVNGQQINVTVTLSFS